MPYYAVARGREVGIYSSWRECRPQVYCCKGARYRKFENLIEAKNIVKTTDDTTFIQYTSMEHAEIMDVKTPRVDMEFTMGMKTQEMYQYL